MPAAAPPRAAPTGARPRRPAPPTPGRPPQPPRRPRRATFRTPTGVRPAGPPGRPARTATRPAAPARHCEQDTAPADRRTRAPTWPRERVQRGHAQPAERQRGDQPNRDRQAVGGQQQPAGEGQTEGRAGRLDQPPQPDRGRRPRSAGEPVQTGRREGRHDQRPDQHGEGVPDAGQGQHDGGEARRHHRRVEQHPRRTRCRIGAASGGQPGQSQPGERGAGTGGQRDHHRGRDQVDGTGEEEQRHRHGRGGLRCRTAGDEDAERVREEHGGRLREGARGRCGGAGHRTLRVRYPRLATMDGRNGYLPVTQGRQRPVSLYGVPHAAGTARREPKQPEVGSSEGE